VNKSIRKKDYLKFRVELLGRVGSPVHITTKGEPQTLFWVRLRNKWKEAPSLRFCCKGRLCNNLRGSAAYVRQGLRRAAGTDRQIDGRTAWIQNINYQWACGCLPEPPHRAGLAARPARPPACLRISSTRSLVSSPNFSVLCPCLCPFFSVTLLALSSTETKEFKALYWFSH